MKHFFKYLAFMAAAAACDKEGYKPADIGLDYFPLRTGQYQVYQIDETIYSAVAQPETLAYEIMVEVADSFPDGEGTVTYVLNRSRRPDGNSLWQPMDTWSVRATDRELIVNEGNMQFVRLTFPSRKGNRWNGNKYNNSGEDEYELISMDEEFVAGGTTFEKTLTVNQENNEDFIVYLDKREEVYARKVGLIYKETTQLNYCTQDDCRGQQIVESGTIYKQQITDYGLH